MKDLKPDTDLPFSWSQWEIFQRTREWYEEKELENDACEKIWHSFEECDQVKDLDSALSPANQAAVCFVKIGYSKYQEVYEKSIGVGKGKQTVKDKS